MFIGGVIFLFLEITMDPFLLVHLTHNKLEKQ